MSEETAIVMQTVSQDTAERIARETCVLELHRHEPGFEKKIPATEFLGIANQGRDKDIDISPERLAVTKSLVDRKELKELRKHRDSFFQSIKDLSLPGGMLTIGNGQFLIPVSMIQIIKAKIDKYLSERDSLLDDFAARYPEIIEASRERLGVLFDSLDYPDFHIIRSQYSTSYKFVSNSIPEEIEKYSKEIAEAEKKRILEECASTSTLIQSTLRERFLDIVSHFKDRLGTDEATGKPRRFHGSNVEHLKEFIDLFSHMNLTGDGELSELISTTKALVNDVDVDKVRTDQEFRAELEKSFEGIKAGADKLITERKRKVILED